MVGADPPGCLQPLGGVGRGHADVDHNRGRRVSPDLRNATVFVMPLGGAHLPEVVAGLQRARGYFRAQMARMVEARFVPELSFKADESFETAARIDVLLKESTEADGGADGGTS